MVDTPTVKVLTGLTVPEFEAEMQLMTQALGLSCGSCHARGNFASDANPRKLAARRMIEMTKSDQRAVLRRLQAAGRAVAPRPRHLLHLPPGRHATQDPAVTRKETAESAETAETRRKKDFLCVLCGLCGFFLS